MVNFIKLCENVLLVENAPKRKVVSASGVNGSGTTTVTYDDGTTETLSGPRPIRNNNPGNLEYGPFAQRQGAVGSDGRYAVFPTKEDGWNAKVNLLKTNTYQSLSIKDAFNRYAPPSENPNYIRDLQNLTGFDINRRMNTLSNEEFQQLVNAVAKIEGAEEYVGKFNTTPTKTSWGLDTLNSIFNKLFSSSQTNVNTPIAAGSPSKYELDLLQRLHNSPYNPQSSMDRKNLGILRQAGRLIGGYQDFEKLVPTVYALQYGNTPTGEKYRQQAKTLGVPIDTFLAKGTTAASMPSRANVITNTNIVQSRGTKQTGPGFTIPGAFDKNNRPVILSQSAASAFAQMISDSNNVVTPSDITSSQRSSSHNAKVGGAKRSKHLQGLAIDIHGGSKDWIKQNGSIYGWYLIDYPGSHGSHFEYRG